MENLLDGARELAKNRRWPELARVADSAEHDAIAASPELAYLVADALRRVGRTADALKFACRADIGALRSADRGLQLRSINLVGMLDYESGALAAAETRFEQLLEFASDWHDDEFVARASNNLGVLANIQGRRDLALTYYKRALAAYSRLGHARGLAQTHYNLGISYRDLGFPDDADRQYATAIRFAGEANSDDVIAHTETERAYLRALAGDGDLAEAIAARALRSLEAMEDPGGCANAIRVLAVAAEARGEPALALRRLDDARSILAKHPDQLLEAEVDRDLGRIHLEGGQRELAVAALERARDSFAKLGANGEVQTTLDLLSAAQAASG